MDQKVIVIVSSRPGSRPIKLKLPWNTDWDYNLIYDINDKMLPWHLYIYIEKHAMDIGLLNSELTIRERCGLSANARWLQAERFILKVPHLCYSYSTAILCKRWRKAEKVIKRHEMWHCYCSFYGLKPPITL